MCDEVDFKFEPDDYRVLEEIYERTCVNDESHKELAYIAERERKRFIMLQKKREATKLHREQMRDVKLQQERAASKRYREQKQEKIRKARQRDCAIQRINVRLREQRRLLLERRSLLIKILQEKCIHNMLTKK
jgi:hypothetical protein